MGGTKKVIPFEFLGRTQCRERIGQRKVEHNPASHQLWRGRLGKKARAATRNACNRNDFKRKCWGEASARKYVRGRVARARAN